MLTDQIQYMRGQILTFLDGSSFHTAANQVVIGCLVADYIQQEWHLCWVAEGDLGHQRSLKTTTVLHRSVPVQEVTVLLIGQHLGKHTESRFVTKIIKQRLVLADFIINQYSLLSTIDQEIGCPDQSHLKPVFIYRITRTCISTNFCCPCV